MPPVRSAAQERRCAALWGSCLDLRWFLLRALAGTVGSFLQKYKTVINVIFGLIMVLFGLNFMGVLKINLFRGMGFQARTDDMDFFRAMLFGIIFSVGWTPCVGAFLGSALMLASQQGSALIGIGMLLCYSLGLGVPFLISAVLMDQLKNAFDFIKRNYRIINLICGGLLVAVGVAMATGMLDKLLNLLR